MTMTASAPGLLELPTGTAVPVPVPVPADQFHFGTRVKIAPEARDISGSALGHDERTGTVQGVTEHCHSGERFYRIGTDGGTDVVIHTDFVTQVHETVPATVSVELYTAHGWNQVTEINGRALPTGAKIRATQEAVDAYVLRWAAKLRREHQSIRVTITTDDGRLTAWHEDLGSRMPVDPRNPRYPVMLVLTGGQRPYMVTFGSPQARLVGALALADDPAVATVDPDPSPTL